MSLRRSQRTIGHQAVAPPFFPVVYSRAEIGRPSVNELVLKVGTLLAKSYHRGGVHEVCGGAMGALLWMHAVVWNIILGGHPFQGAEVPGFAQT